MHAYYLVFSPRMRYIFGLVQTWHEEYVYSQPIGSDFKKKKKFKKNVKFFSDNEIVWKIALNCLKIIKLVLIGCTNLLPYLNNDL